MNYYALLVGMVLVTALMMHGTREKNLKYVIVACLLLYAVYGLRNTYYIGNDTTTSYLVNFNRMMNRDWDGVLDYAQGRNVLFYLMTKAFTLYIPPRRRTRGCGLRTRSSRRRSACPRRRIPSRLRG